jgi:hypothetical protein
MVVKLPQLNTTDSTSACLDMVSHNGLVVPQQYKELFFVVLGFELRAYTLSHSTSHIFVIVIF